MKTYQTLRGYQRAVTNQLKKRDGLILSELNDYQKNIYPIYDWWKANIDPAVAAKLASNTALSIGLKQCGMDPVGSPLDLGDGIIGTLYLPAKRVK